MNSIKIILITAVILFFLGYIYLFSGSDVNTNSNEFSVNIDPNSTCVDNTIKMAVYLPETGTVTFDPLCTAMFFGDKLDYLNDSNIANNLTTSNYALLLVPKQEMTSTTATVINKYIANGGSVWFFADPSYLPDGTVVKNNRITILGNATYSSNNTIASNSTITMDNTDVITDGMPNEFNPVSTQSKWYFFRSFSPQKGTVSGFNYSVLMNNGNCAMMIKFENPKTGSRVIYSNRNMFISGGNWSYFDAQLATRLFQQTKAWMLKLTPNTYGVTVTYPRGDKQFTITLDDEQAAAYEIPKIQAFFAMEKEHGVNPADVNTFFIIPTHNTTGSALASYSENGDTHTLHPHNIADWTNNQSVSDYHAYIAKAEGIIYDATDEDDYGITSWRFPGTAFCLNSLRAVTESNILIDSSFGRVTNNGKIGTAEDNNMFFPKRIVIDGIETNTVEMEMTSNFDLNSDNGSAYYAAYANYLPYLKNGNFPANFIVVGHFQCAATLPDYIDGTAKIIDASKATNTSYATLDTLGKYINTMQDTKIKAANSNGSVTVVVTTSKIINDFTIKIANVKNGVKAQYDGVAIDNDNIIYDGSTCYIVHTLGTGTHAFTITDKF
jgi:hypothetical protein